MIKNTIIEELKNTINIKKEMVAKENEKEELKKIALLPENVAKREMEKINREFNIKISNLLFELNKNINKETWSKNFQVETYFPMSTSTSDEATEIVVSNLKDKIKFIQNELIDYIKFDVLYEKENIYEDDCDDFGWGGSNLLHSYNNVIVKVSISF